MLRKTKKKLLEKRNRKIPLDYALKNIPAKFADDQSTLRHKNLGGWSVTGSNNLVKSKRTIK